METVKSGAGFSKDIGTVSRENINSHLNVEISASLRLPSTTTSTTGNINTTRKFLTNETLLMLRGDGCADDVVLA